MGLGHHRRELPRRGCLDAHGGHARHCRDAEAQPISCALFALAKQLPGTILRATHSKAQASVSNHV